MELKPGWLNRQFEAVERQIDTWPDWMKREAGYPISEKAVEEYIERPTAKPVRIQCAADRQAQ